MKATAIISNTTATKIKKIITKTERKVDSDGKRLCDIKLKTTESDRDRKNTLNAHSNELFFILYFILFSILLKLKVGENGNIVKRSFKVHTLTRSIA